MKKVVKRTGDHGIGQMVHVVHMTDDVQALRAFYEDVMGGVVFMGVDEPNYLPIEDRYANLIMVGDLCVETMAPRMPPDVTKPVGRFYSRFGRHLHSVGYKVDDLTGLADRLIRKGVYIGKPGGGRLEKADPDTMYFFPSPRDTAGLMVELCGMDMPGEPRDLDMWSSLVRLWRTHPLTIERFSYVTLGVRDLESAVKTYVDVMQAVPIQAGTDQDLGARYQTLQLGDCLLQLAEPLNGECDLGRHVEQWGNMIYSLRFKVLDIDSAVSWLSKHGVRTRRIRDGLVVTDVRDTFGAPIFFGTEEIEGDPFV
ncbi:catechol 2,3-dioxygenase-like lactoylglutathione lyase family enzyme [Thermocatellispora tengchongensis]|uniref:Catechol 2,3-dioxygenase-like lactoylglutathione lyase family enzyme n=1 Tax=Thermocatellispora tengchongensis TaxID=1073253 RepID=A0A840PII0_9ACTN|nr:VOC family protein [Thermocatellispora tengchongensis]MBB5137360.1 catechol 2,3-dioxygenase-like lactoylglutathione lyase family enzyme [Thermocatellispora tengchongensis]